jgi:regulatory Fis family protein
MQHRAIGKFSSARLQEQSGASPWGEPCAVLAPLARQNKAWFENVLLKLNVPPYVDVELLQLREEGSVAIARPIRRLKVLRGGTNVIEQPGYIEVLFMHGCKPASGKFSINFRRKQYRKQLVFFGIEMRDQPRCHILPLANQFLHQERAPLRFSPEVQARLLAHSWPGNVRELQNVVRHGAALATGPEVGVLDLPDELGTELRASRPAPRAPAQELRPLADVEREHVLRVLELCGGSQSEAATVLGIARNTLWRKLRAYSAS